MLRATGSTCLVLALVLVGCGSDDSGGGKTVNAGEREFKIDVSPAQTAAGAATFEVRNQGQATHELVVLKTDLAPDALPVKDNEADESAKGITRVDEVGDIAPGKTERLSADLKPGRYVLICNLAGHYEAGMHTGFTVG